MPQPGANSAQLHSAFSAEGILRACLLAWFVMVLGTLTITLHVPDSGSLKEKRQVVRSLTARLRQTFNASVAEVGDQDLWQSAVIGIVCVSSEARHADEMCQKILRFVDGNADALVTGSRFELVHV